MRLISSVEMGLPEHLTGQVTRILPCPEIVEGPGRVVLTTVNHLNPDVVELTLQDSTGSEETLRPTATHKFYSVTRSEWLSASKLREGETLDGANGLISVTAVNPIPGVHRVYNMTVQGEHLYRVASCGVLVHNTRCKPVLLGEHMPRVRAAAEAHELRAWPARNWDDWEIAGVEFQKNRRWLRDQIRSGAEIYSLGKTPGFSRSDYYRAEVALLLEKGYRRRFDRMIDVPGFGEVKLYVWEIP